MRIINHYTVQERLNDILDKISSFGINSITDKEMIFLKSFKTKTSHKVHNEMLKKEKDLIFKDDDDLFEFKFIDIFEDGDMTVIEGIISVPSLEIDNKIIKGNLKGEILLTKGEFFLDFFYFSDEYSLEVDEFVSGYEYEFDNFIEHVIEEIMKIEKNNI